MPSPKRRHWIAAMVALLLVLACVIGFFFQRGTENTVVLDDGSVLTIVDFTTEPNEGLYVGAVLKKPITRLLKDSHLKSHVNAGYLNVTNLSAVSWQRTGASTNRPLVTALVWAVDFYGTEHAGRPKLSYYEKDVAGQWIEIGVMTFPVRLEPPAWLRVDLKSGIKELPLKK